jgi:multicomponent K+:H+ antiporter subunit G
MSASASPWVDAVTGLLAAFGALAALIGSFGVLRLRSFFQRVHAPTLGATLGTWGLTLATVVQASFEHGQLYVHALLIAVFMGLTGPVTTVFLMRAAVFRGRLRGTEIPVPTVDESPPG